MTTLICDEVQRPSTASCHSKACGWQKIHLLPRYVTALAAAHVEQTGHIVSLIHRQETVIQRSHLQPVPDPEPMPGLGMPARRPWPQA